LKGRLIDHIECALASDISRSIKITTGSLDSFYEAQALKPTSLCRCEFR
jgi:hypothetical protein